MKFEEEKHIMKVYTDCGIYLGNIILHGNEYKFDQSMYAIVDAKDLAGILAKIRELNKRIK